MRTSEEFRALIPVYQASQPPGWELVVEALKIAAMAVEPGWITAVLTAGYREFLASFDGEVKH